jgi:hypothetical protein
MHQNKICFFRWKWQHEQFIIWHEDDYTVCAGSPGRTNFKIMRDQTPPNWIHLYLSAKGLLVTQLLPTCSQPHRVSSFTVLFNDADSCSDYITLVVDA